MLDLKKTTTQDRITFSYLLFFPFLCLAAFIYGFCVWLTKFLYRAGVLSIQGSRKAKLLSIGNITCGGSGKTPLVEELASFLNQEGCRVAVLLRGYKRPKKREVLGNRSYAALGDEGSMLKENLGSRVDVRVGHSRVGLVRKLDEEKACDVILLDDGFQHWRLRRDLDIVAIDALKPFGNGLLLPAGHLREPLSALKRADVFCLTHTDEASSSQMEDIEATLKNLNPRALLVHSVHQPETLIPLGSQERRDLHSLKEKAVCLLCGLARPDHFSRTVVALGAKPVLRKYFGDHHAFTLKEIAGVVEECLSRRIRTIVTTQKDSQRLQGLFKSGDFDIDLLVLGIKLRITHGGEALYGRVRSLCHA